MNRILTLEDTPPTRRRGRRRVFRLSWALLGGVLLLAGVNGRDAAATMPEGPADDAYGRFGGPAFSLVTPSPASLPPDSPGLLPGGQDWLEALTTTTPPLATPVEPIQLAGPPAAATHALSIANRSGLPWRSGAACPAGAGGGGISSFRGAPLDVLTNFLPRDNWDQIFKAVGWLGEHRGKPYVVSAGIGLLPKSQSGSFAACGRGAFDGYYRRIGAGIRAAGMGNMIIRLGWEPNGEHNPWFMGANDPEPYKRCFRRAVSAIKSQAPNVTIQWTPRRDSNRLRYPIERGYPGDGFVDQIGIQMYDYYPVHTSDGVWNEAYSRRQRGTGGLFGLGTFLGFAKAHGRKLAVAEWGVADGYKTSGGIDNPLYVRRMLDFAKRNTSSVAYETYFNCFGRYGRGVFNITPASDNPRAASTYRTFIQSN